MAHDITEMPWTVTTRCLTLSRNAIGSKPPSTHDGTIGYPEQMVHGETGRGTNDYDAFFRLLRSVGFAGWISVEDGMNGLDELRRSVEFLKRKRFEHYGA